MRALITSSQRRLSNCKPFPSRLLPRRDPEVTQQSIQQSEAKCADVSSNGECQRAN